MSDLENDIVENDIVDNNEVTDESIKISKLKQSLYLFTSFEKYFKTAKERPIFLIPLAMVLIILFMCIPFLSSYGEIIAEESIPLYEELYSRPIYAAYDKEMLVETAIESVKAQYTPVRYIVINFFIYIGVTLLSALFILIVSAILKGEATYKSIFSATIGLQVFSTIYVLYLMIISGFTNSTVDITSVLAFVQVADATSPMYIIFSSLNLFLILRTCYYYYLSKSLLCLNKSKSILATSIFILTPIVLSVIVSVLTSSLI